MWNAQDSVAVALPELQHPTSDTLYLEAWRGLRPIGNSVDISVTSLLLVGLLGVCWGSRVDVQTRVTWRANI